MIRTRRFRLAAACLLGGLAALVSVQTSNAEQPAPAHQVSEGFITDWLICGPFPNPPRAGLAFNDHTRPCVGMDTDYLADNGGEAGIVPKVNTAHVSPEGRSIVWRPARATGGYVDFDREFRPNDNVVAYAFCRLESEIDQDVVFQLGSDDGIKLWIDDRLVFSNETARGAQADQDFVAVRLAKGMHRCLVKVCEGNGDWGFYFRCRTLAAAAAAARLDFDRDVSIATSPTLGHPGDLISVSVFDPERARELGLGFSVKYTAADLAGDRIAALSSRTDSPAVFHTRTWPTGGYSITAEVDSPGSGPIRVSRFIYLGDYSKAVDRFIREAPLGFAQKSRPAMSLDYCIKRLETLRESGPEALNAAAEEVVEYMRWALHFRAAKDPADAYRDWRGSYIGGYWSAIDDSAQHYAVYAPDAYYRGDPIPLVVSLHGYDPANRSYTAWNRQVRSKMRALAEKHRCLILEPFGRGNTFYRGIGRADVLQTIEEVCRDYDVDRDRVYLMGYSMGGSGTWAIGTFYADRFAAIAPVFGGPPYPLPLTSHDEQQLNRRFGPYRVSPFSCADNLLNTPVFINHGDADQLVTVDYSRQMALILQRLGYDVRYWEHPGKGHGGLPIEGVLFDWFLRCERPTAPSRVKLKAATLHHGKMDWVAIERFFHLSGPAEIDARIAPGNLISVESDNVSVLSLTPTKDLIDPTKPLDVVWNGAEAEVERVADGKWRLVAPGTPRDALTAPLRKTAEFEGPIDAVHQSPFIIVQGTQAPDAVMRAVVEAEAHSISDAWTQWQHTTPRMKIDADVTLADMQSYNLIVVGGADENFIAAKLLAELPVSVGVDSIRLFDQEYSGFHLGLALLYPNPLAPDKYVLFLLGTSPAGLSGLSARMNGTFDFYLSDAKTLGREHKPGTMVIEGRFDQQWQLRPQYITIGSEAVRAEVTVGRRAPLHASVAGAPDTLYLSDLVPSRRYGAFRDPALDRTAYGEALRLGPKRRFRDNTCDKGIASSVCHGENRIEYELGGLYKRFRATVGLQRPEGAELTEQQRANTGVIFTVTGDGKRLWQSEPIGWDDQAAAVDITIDGVKALSLSVSNATTWHYRADSVNWYNARVER